MTVVWNRPEVRRLPSRHHFALARLVVMLLPERPTPAVAHRRIAMPIDRDQNSIEHYAVSAGVTLIATCYIMALLTPYLGPAFVPLVAFGVLLITPLLLQLPFYFSGAVLAPVWHTLTGAEARHNERFNAWFELVLLILASSYFAASKSWARFVAWPFFAILGANLVAAILMWLMRSRVAEMERRCIT